VYKELSAYEVLQDFSETADDEIRDFLQIVARFVTADCCYIVIIVIIF